MRTDAELEHPAHPKHHISLLWHLERGEMSQQRCRNRVPEQRPAAILARGVQQLGDPQIEGLSELGDHQRSRQEAVVLDPRKVASRDAEQLCHLNLGQRPLLPDRTQLRADR